MVTSGSHHLGRLRLRAVGNAAAVNVCTGSGELWGAYLLNDARGVLLRHGGSHPARLTPPATPSRKAGESRLLTSFLLLQELVTLNFSPSRGSVVGPPGGLNVCFPVTNEIDPSYGFISAVHRLCCKVSVQIFLLACLSYGFEEVLHIF